MFAIKTARLAALMCSAALAMPALADGSIKDAPEPAKRDLQLSANFAATTEYVFRGFSQTGGDPTVQGGVDLTYKWFYAGLWASGLDFGRDLRLTTGNLVDVANVEIDYYLGIKPVIMGFTLDFGVIYYSYPGAHDHRVLLNRELDYVELKLGWSREIWKDGTWASTFFYSPEYTNKTGDVLTSESTFTQVLPKLHDITPTFSATLGYQTNLDKNGTTANARFRGLIGNGDDNYYYWNAGVTLGFGDRFSLDLRYWDTNVSNNGGFCTGPLFQCDERFVGTAKVTF